MYKMIIILFTVLHISSLELLDYNNLTGNITTYTYTIAFPKTGTQNLRFLQEKIQEDAVENLVEKIIKQYKYEDTMVVPFHETYLDNILKWLKIRTIVNPTEGLDKLRNLGKFHIYIIIIRSITDLEKFLNESYDTPTWNSRAKYLVIYVNHHLDNTLQNRLDYSSNKSSNREDNTVDIVDLNLVDAVHPDNSIYRLDNQEQHNQDSDKIVQSQNQSTNHLDTQVHNHIGINSVKMNTSLDADTWRPSKDKFPKKANLQKIQDIFELTWRYFLLNINLIVETATGLEIYTHYPYYDGSCGLNITPAKLDKDIFDIFPEKVDLDLKGCDIKLMGLNIKPYVIDITQDLDDPTKSGLEVTIIHNVFRKMNFTEHYIQNPYPHWGYLLLDGNFTYTFRALHDKASDIIFGMTIGNETMEEYFDTSVAHIDTAAVWLVPTALQIPQWKNLTVIFDGIVWFSIFVVFVLNGIVWWIIGRGNEKISAYRKLTLCLMGSFYILLQGSFISPKAWKLRFVVIIWSLSSLLIFTAHQCQLTGILTSPLYEHQISNLQDLVDSHLDYGFYPILRDLYSDPKNKVHQKILHTFRPCSLTPECMNRTAFKRDFAVIKNRRQGAYLLPKYYTFPNGKPMLYMFKESEFVAWVKYYVRKGFPFLDRVDNLILLLKSNGLIAKWESDVAPSGKADDDLDLEPLSLNHLQGAFFLLLFGHLAASIAFVSEKFRRTISKNKIGDIGDVNIGGNDGGGIGGNDGGGQGIGDMISGMLGDLFVDEDIGKNRNKFEDDNIDNRRPDVDNEIGVERCGN